ncbi:MAG: hypothetical protein PHI90_10795 [Clostridia bacterium]|nr:hypothetical protein [Clostridia bacterium]MDD4049276.1 hypothetical protein [Clostridia bacterium]
MITDSCYTFIILSVAGGLLTLLGSVGTFISIITQRRLDKLQDILEEFVSLSYRSETNLTGLMYNLIEKYQMHYMFPLTPRKMIFTYIDINIFFILVLWATTLLMQYEPPFSSIFILQIAPLLIGTIATIFFRHLLRATINLENPLLNTIVPAPEKLRNLSYLSRFVNLSVKSVLKQGRPTIFLSNFRDNPNVNGTSNLFKVSLKEELSFDNFFYYLCISNSTNPLFISFGDIKFHFSPDPITKKPVPVHRNINVPLGEFPYSRLPNQLIAHFLVFTNGEKHPLEFIYHLEPGTCFFSAKENPQVTVNHQILYTVEKSKLIINECQTCPPFFQELSHLFRLNNNRYYIHNPGKWKSEENKTQTNLLKLCQEKVFID